MEKVYNQSIKTMNEQINYNQLEQYRQKNNKNLKLVIFLDLMLFIPMNLWFILSNIIYRDNVYFLTFILINMINIVIINYYVSYKLRSYRQKIRQKSLPKLFHNFGDESTHEYDTFFEQSIHATRLYNRIDQLSLKNIITGNINYANITRADVKLGNITFFSNRRRKYVPICHGHWYILDVNQSFNGVTHIKQRNKNYIFKSYERPRVDDSPFKEVKTNDETFNNEFEVFSTDQQQANKLLTSGVMTHLNRLNARYPGQIIVAITGHHVHLGIHHYMKKFNPPVFTKINKETLEDQIKDLKILGDLIIELHQIK